MYVHTHACACTCTGGACDAPRWPLRMFYCLCFMLCYMLHPYSIPRSRESAARLVACFASSASQIMPTLKSRQELSLTRCLTRTTPGVAQPYTHVHTQTRKPCTSIRMQINAHASTCACTHMLMHTHANARCGSVIKGVPVGYLACRPSCKLRRACQRPHTWPHTPGPTHLAPHTWPHTWSLLELPSRAPF